MMMWPLPDDGAFSDSWRRVSAAHDSDVGLSYEVADRLLGDDRIRYQRVTVTVQNRVVLLAGVVDTPALKQVVSDAAFGVSGVADVCNALRVREPGGSGTADDHQFQAMVAALQAGDPLRGERLTEPRRGSALALWAIAAAILWAVLLILMVRFGWAGVAVSCVVAGLALTVIGGRALRTRGATTSSGP